MEITECIHTCSSCFEKSPPIGRVAGIVVHSTGADNPYLRRYVSPSPDDPRRGELLALLGKNRYGNHWNRKIKKAVHYFVGKDWEGRVRTVRVLPEEIAGTVFYSPQENRHENTLRAYLEACWGGKYYPKKDQKG